MTNMNITERVSYSTGKWWLYSIMAPFVSAVIGFVFALLADPINDPLGFRLLFYPLLGSIFGGLVSLVLALVSFKKGESNGKSALAFSSMLILALVIVCVIIIDAGEDNYKERRAAIETHINQAIKDPGVVLSEKWYDEKSVGWNKHQAYKSSLKKVPYTDEILRELFLVKPSGDMLKHPGWSSESLVEKYNEMLELDPADRNKYYIQNILLNVRAPVDLQEDAVNNNIYTAEELKEIFSRKGVYYWGPK